jgi:hypothetical protein
MSATRMPPPATTPAPMPTQWRRSEAVGDVVANAVLLFLVNVAPGWQVVPFFTPAFDQVLPLLNTAMVVGLAFGLVRLVARGRAAKAVRDIVTGVLGCALMLRFWQVFPFAVGAGWTVVFRIILVMGIVGTAIAVVVGVVSLVAALARPRPPAAQ